jgi:hypothetical protein
VDVGSHLFADPYELVTEGHSDAGVRDEAVVKVKVGPTYT